MEDFKSILIDHLKRQGLSFTLICIFAYYFYIEVELLQNQVRDCEASFRITLLKMMDHQNSSLDDIHDHIDEIK